MTFSSPKLIPRTRNRLIIKEGTADKLVVEHNRMADSNISTPHLARKEMVMMIMQTFVTQTPKLSTASRRSNNSNNHSSS